MREHASIPRLFLMEHNDGFRTAALMLSRYVTDWAYAARVDGQIEASEFYLQPVGPGANFGYLCRNIERFFQTGVAPYPPERTLLATGIIDAVMNSRHEDHRLIETPYLDIAYRPDDTEIIRPTGTRPRGASVDRSAPDQLLAWE